jgi:hypothetical protein
VKNVFKFICLFFLLHGINQICFSQETGGIRVIVKDSATLETIPSAIIRVMNTSLGTSSYINGFYMLKNIPAGEQTIQVTSVGYKRYLKKIIIVKDAIKDLSVILLPEPVVLNAVVNSAERQRRTFETNISQQSISRLEIGLSPKILEKDIFRTIKSLSGISSSGDVTSQFFVRGGAGNQNLIIFDNMLIFNPFHALGLFSVFDADIIKTSDVITGGFSPEYGGRLSSVINIVSKDGNRNNFSGKVNFGALTGTGLLEGPIGNGSFYLSYRKSLFDKVLKNFVNKELPLSFYDFTGKAVFDVFTNSKLSFSLLSTSDDIDNPNEDEPDYNWKNKAYGVSFKSCISNFISTLSFSISDFTTHENTNASSTSDQLNSNVHDMYFFFNADYLTGYNDLVSAGFSLINQDLKFSYMNSSSYLINNNENVVEKNLWLKYKFTRIKDFIAELGVRSNIGDKTNKTFYNLEPRLNLKYQLFSDFSLKGSFSRMHQYIISTTNDNDLIPLFEAWIPISQNYYPERADQVVFGFDYFFDNINITLQGYNKKIYNYMDYNLNRKSAADPDFISGTGKSYGIETYIKFGYEQFYGWFTYNLNWAKIEVNGKEYYPRFDKRHNISLTLGTKLILDIDLSLNWELSSGMPFTPVIGYYSQIPFSSETLNLNTSGFEQHAIYGERNSSRLPYYHKMDISLSKFFVFEHFLFFNQPLKMNIIFDCINIYDHKNIFYFNKLTGEKIYMLPFLPALSIGFEI